ncbi:Lin1244/Lin1753 domain-containing protein [Gordonibacter massiliensis (ex Traore et al. 2017)]|uniref:Lin1244/Lin1753 domain-containing protein n=1 Tax=Gordonibacter massiliensis (ex Traore et al. 2017) TaxID=1841863 RepID=UPI001C8B115B|nr:Lin1244/Lin1753 domain-containing protein [Gordonibacter massiliensis (ex Traore et al. 2017)]MBX9035066.1 DUF4373 domain-containing protein [Gordonibacter massiliensis (ex Traore et al. 2017)]
MARPRKDSLDYFPLDVGLLSNPKMMMAVNDVGSDAVSVYVALLGAVYSRSYWMPKDDERLQVLPAKLHLPVERFNRAYDALLRWRLVDEVSAKSEVEKRECPCGVAVTSMGMQEQYFAIKTRVISEKLPFLLVEPALEERF